MPGTSKLIIEVTETDHGFLAQAPGYEDFLRGFGPTIPGALRALGTRLVEARENLHTYSRVLECTSEIQRRHLELRVSARALAE